MGGVSIDEDGGRAEGQRAEMRSDQLDFSKGECGGGNNVVNAGVGKDFSGGLRAGASHGDDLQI
jgi:hypothetical protein